MSIPNTLIKYFLHNNLMNVFPYFSVVVKNSATKRHLIHASNTHVQYFIKTAPAVCMCGVCKPGNM